MLVISLLLKPLLHFVVFLLGLRFFSQAAGKGPSPGLQSQVKVLPFFFLVGKCGDMCNGVFSLVTFNFFGWSFRGSG